MIQTTDKPMKSAQAPLGSRRLTTLDGVQLMAQIRPAPRRMTRAELRATMRRLLNCKANRACRGRTCERVATLVSTVLRELSLRGR